MMNKDTLSENQRLMALGLLTVRAAKLEEDLRRAFCSLVASKYAPVVAGGQGMSWLIEQCQALVKANREMSDDRKDALLAALVECKNAMEQRNTLVHGIKISGESRHEIMTSRSRRGTSRPTVESWTDAKIRAVASRLSAVRGALSDAINDGLSFEATTAQFALHEKIRGVPDWFPLDWDSHREMRRSVGRQKGPEQERSDVTEVE